MDRKKSGFNRREFVVGGATAVAALAASTPSLFAAEQKARQALISVGYLTPSPSFTRRALRAPMSFQSAEGVLTGDPAFFSRGARIRVSGVHADRDHALSIDVLYSVPELGKKVPYFAWTSGGNGVAFNAPVEVMTTLDMQVERRVGTGGSAVIERGVLSFTALSARDSYKLNPGTYALAFRNAGEAEPDWRSIRMDKGTLLTESLGQLSPVKFNYLLLNVDYQTAA